MQSSSCRLAPRTSAAFNQSLRNRARTSGRSVAPDLSIGGPSCCHAAPVPPQNRARQFSRLATRSTHGPVASSSTAPRPSFRSIHSDKPIRFRNLSTATSTRTTTEQTEPAQSDIAGWNHAIVDTPGGLDAIKQRIQEMKEAGISPTIETYHAVAPHLAKDLVSRPPKEYQDPNMFSNRVYALLEEWNDLLGMDADDYVGRTIMQAITRDSSARTGQKARIPRHTATTVLSSLFYDISLQRPFATDERLSDVTAREYVCWLCDVRGGDDLKAARDAFTYFLGVWEVDPSAATTRTLDGDRTPMQEMAGTILTGMAKRSKDVAKEATPFIDDLRERRITVAEGDKMRLIKRLMESTVDHRDAFRMYSWVRGLNPKAFTYDQYLEIINHFADLALPKSPRVPPELLAEFITDIKKAGRRMDAKMYTTIISRFTRFLRQRRRQLTETELLEMVPSADDQTVSQTLHIVRKLHGTIRLDSFLDVDVPLLNAIMDAYNQLGAWPECFTVWQELVDQHAWETSREAYQPSLSIILDACGYSGQLVRGRRIWRWATRGAVPVNRNNLAAWVECLCRTGRVVEAAELLCGGELKAENATPDFAVDKRLLELPLKFALRHDDAVRQQVRAMIREKYPDEWASFGFIAPRSQ